MILKRERTVLFVIDMQEKLLPHVYNHQAVLDNVKRLVALARTLNLPLLISEQYPKGLGKTVEDLVKELGNLYQPIEKMTFSCMGETLFRERIFNYRREGVDQVIVTGIEAHVCVYQTVVNLLEEGFDVHVVTDAVGSRVEANHSWSLELMGSAGSWTKPTETVIFEMLERAGTPEFKGMIPYVR